jgi:transcriptional regulator with XRE-family HTH domain
MINFNQQYLDYFLGVVRKYMQLRGGLTQKDLAELTGTGISTISRFLNLKTKDIDSQLAAKIIVKLNIPLHEITDFISEESTDSFKNLVGFVKESQRIEEKSHGLPSADNDIKNELTNHGEIQLDSHIVEALKLLTPRQKAYVKDFLELDAESRDLVVDIGNSLLQYFKQKNLNF